MVGITEISAVVAAAGVLVGVVYYILQIRHQSRMRQTELLTRLYSTLVSKDWLDAWQKVQDREILDHGEYSKKYGFLEMNEVGLFLIQLGKLLKRGLIDVDLMPLSYGQVKTTWEKMKPIMEGGKRRFNTPKLGDEVEYLCRELEKSERRGVKNG